MASTTAAQNNEDRPYNNEGAISAVPNSPASSDGNMTVGEGDEEDDEEEDVDFSPFLRGDSPSEASSSLSSDNEDRGKSVDRKLWSCSNGQNGDASLTQPEEKQDREGEETVIEAVVQGEEGFSGSSTKDVLSASITQDGLSGDQGNNNKTSSLIECNGSHCLTKNETSKRSIIEMDDKDAICKRTRARHSLANYTLEELETFLQESDDDGDPPNVDDEEEYRKFLAAVLAEGAEGRKEDQGCQIVDEDEDNDADFELEIEEALESDVDETFDIYKQRDGKQPSDAHMRVTRQKKRLNESSKNKKTFFGQATMQLRPLVPYESTKASVVPAPGQFSAPIALPPTGFTAPQIGQLYCLIHEHAQLLIQVFSICVLDPSKQEVSSEVQKMISELICRQEEALKHQKVPYPEFCFHPPNLQSSLGSDNKQTAVSFCWTPSIINPVMSILDVAPLHLVKSFMADVSDTVGKYRKSCFVTVSNKSNLIKEPLFPLPEIGSSSTADMDSSGRTATMYSNPHPFIQASLSQEQTKKSLATVLVESTKKQSVVLVPKDIAKSAKRFFPLFNAALFPHKPPAQAIANRFLFTDAEDGLLAMGIMQFNNDWAAIQQRFLPCKSEHQIFIRQKNRSSSKAPENPIKAVRRMKTCPLTAEEKAHIHEGLKIFKNDWLSVWKFIVPHRDPSLLPRLWRIATGTQKSYKKSEAMKQKRRLYDAKRRKMKASMDELTSSDKEVDDGENNSAGDADGEEEAYVHEAFLADPEPGTSRQMSSNATVLSLGRCKMQSVSITAYRGGTYFRETSANRSGYIQQESSHMYHNSSPLHPLPHCLQNRNSVPPKQLVNNSISRFSNSRLFSQPCQPHRRKGSRVVKLAPDLPPVNLPPSVRVISRPVLKNYHPELLASAPSDTAVRDIDQRFSQSARGSGVTNAGERSYRIRNDGLETSQQHDESTCASQFGAEENTCDSDLRMHPLLLQSPSSQVPLYYYSTSLRGTGSASQKSFYTNQLQPDLNLHSLQSSTTPGFPGNMLEQAEKTPDFCTIDFHPLLQRVENGKGDSASRATCQLPGNLRDTPVNSSKFFDQTDCFSREPILADKQVVTGSKSLNCSDKENNLDLDIRLSSTPGKGGTIDGECYNVNDIVLSKRMLENRKHDRMLENSLCADELDHGGRFSEVFCTSNLSLQFVPPSNNNEYQFAGDFHDNSLPGIVMEQEELSDSEDEIEPVEFEREEIDDSDEDEEGNRVPSGNQNKEFSFFSSKEDEIQAYHHPVQPSYLVSGLAHKSEKSKRGSTKRNRSCSSPSDVQRSLHAQSSKKRSPEMAKIHPLQVAQRKAAATTRKPRKRTIRAGPSSSAL